MNFDTIVIGSGVAGATAAKQLNQNGLKTAIVEWNEWGGAVVNHGSTSKKILLAAEEAKQAVEQLNTKAFNQVPSIDWAELAAFRKQIVDPMAPKIKDELEAAGITTLKGQAEFVNSHEIKVNGTTYQADSFIIAAGARPRKLEAQGQEHYLYSTDFLNLTEMPETIVIVGAGIISFAFAGIANAAGAKVHVVQHDERALAAFDQELVGKLIEILEQRGVEFHFNQTVERIEPTDTNQYQVTCSNHLTLLTDKIFSVAGRVPNVEFLNLDAADITYAPNGIKVNDYLQTSQPSIYAVGDCNDAPVPKLANYAVLQGMYAADAIIGQKKDKSIGRLNYPVPSMSVFTNPKLALAGVSTVEALQHPEQYEVKTIDMKNWFEYQRQNDTTALAKLVIEKSNGYVVGITSLSNQADYLINYMTLLMDKKVTQTELERLIFAYPTIATDLEKLW